MVTASNNGVIKHLSAYKTGKRQLFIRIIVRRYGILIGIRSTKLCFTFLCLFPFLFQLPTSLVVATIVKKDTRISITAKTRFYKKQAPSKLVSISKNDAFYPTFIILTHIWLIIKSSCGSQVGRRSLRAHLHFSIHNVLFGSCHLFCYFLCL